MKPILSTPDLQASARELVCQDSSRPVITPCKFWNHIPKLNMSLPSIILAVGHIGSCAPRFLGFAHRVVPWLLKEPFENKSTAHKQVAWGARSGHLSRRTSLVHRAFRLWRFTHAWKSIIVTRL